MCSICGKTPCISGCYGTDPHRNIRFTGMRCKHCGDDIAEYEEYVELDNGLYHRDCLDVDMLLDIFGITVKEGEVGA